MKQKSLKIFLAIIFALFTYFQFNDPDPLLWISIYGILTILCFVTAFTEIPKFIYWFAYLGLGIYSVILIPEILNWVNKGMPSIVSEMKAEEPHIEYTREFFGLVISLATVFFIQKMNKRKE